MAITIVTEDDFTHYVPGYLDDNFYSVDIFDVSPIELAEFSSIVVLYHKSNIRVLKNRFGYPPTKIVECVRKFEVEGLV